jgi:hypothetical protein
VTGGLYLHTSRREAKNDHGPRNVPSALFSLSVVRNSQPGRARAQVVNRLSPRRPGVDPGSVHVGFVVDKVALGHVFPRVLRFSPVYFIPPVLHYTEIGKN